MSVNYSIIGPDNSFSPARWHCGNIVKWTLGNKLQWNLNKNLSVFKISAGQQTLTGKIWVCPASYPSLSYINFGKIVLRSGKFQILFWRLIYVASFEKMHLKKLSRKWRPFCLGLNVLIHWPPMMLRVYGIIEVGQDWFIQWLVACWHQVISWTNVAFSSARSWGIHLRSMLPGMF